MKNITSIILFLFIQHHLKAQNNINNAIYFLQQINPAFTGSYKSKNCLSGFFKKEPVNRITKKSATLSYDTKLNVKNNLSNGGLSYSLIAHNESFDGLVTFKSNSVLNCIAYKRNLEEKGKNFLSAGFQLGFTNNNSQTPYLDFEEQQEIWKQFGFSGNFGNSFNFSYLDLNAGIVFQTKLKENLLKSGLSFKHITNPNKNTSNISFNLDQEVIGSICFEKWKSNSQIFELLFCGTLIKSKLETILMGIIFHEKLNYKNKVNFGFHFYSKKNDKTILSPMVGLKIKSLTINTNFDINLEKNRNLNNTNFSLGFIYTKS